MVSHPQKSINHPGKIRGSWKVFILSSLHSSTLLCLRFPYANRAILAASLCQGHQFRRDLRDDWCSAACGNQGMARRLCGLYGKKSHGNHAVQHMFRTNTIYTSLQVLPLEFLLSRVARQNRATCVVRNDACHVKFFPFDSFSRVAGIRWPQPTGKNHCLNPFPMCFWGVHRNPRTKMMFKHQYSQIPSHRWCTLAIFRLALLWKSLSLIGQSSTKINVPFRHLQWGQCVCS